METKHSDIFKDIDVKNYNSSTIATRFDNMVSSLNEVFATTSAKRGNPIYSVWIKFQIGAQKPLLFDTTSQQYNRNLIANLHISKGQNGFANDFTLEIYYDAFKSGQETDKSTAEVLDDWIAEAQSYDFNENLDNDFLTGFIQYGYNNLDDVDRQLCTPIYKFFISNATSETSYSSGITHYTFEGVASLSSDVNFTTSIPKQEGKILDVVERVLKQYYENYELDIDEKDKENQRKDNILPVEATVANPWKYCESLLAEYPLNQTEIDSGNYTEEKLLKMRDGQKPTYVMWITEIEDNRKIIHIKHVSSLANSPTNINLSYEFTWSNNKNNIITGWKPQPSLYLYIIQYGKIRRAQKELQKIENTEAVANDPTFIGPKLYLPAYQDKKQTWQDIIANANDELIKEYYDATLECVGIPTDAPIGGIIKVKPVIFQSQSRTSGRYYITGAEDDISTNGLFTTTLKLFRIGNLE